MRAITKAMALSRSDVCIKSRNSTVVGCQSMWRNTSRTTAAICSRRQVPSKPSASSGCCRSLAICLSRAAAALFGRRCEKTTSSRSAISAWLSNFPISPGISTSKASSIAITISTVSRLPISLGLMFSLRSNYFFATNSRAWLNSGRVELPPSQFFSSSA